MAKLSYLSWAKFGRESYFLARKIKAKKIKVDLVVGIARGGIPVALVIGDILGIRTDYINVKSYTGIYKSTKPKILSTISENIKGKRILLVDDLVDSGATMKFLIKYLKAHKPLDIKTAAIYKKPWSKFDPDFYKSITDAWIVFPWDIEETKKLGK